MDRRPRRAVVDRVVRVDSVDRVDRVGPVGRADSAGRGRECVDRWGREDRAGAALVDRVHRMVSGNTWAPAVRVGPKVIKDSVRRAGGADRWADVAMGRRTAVPARAARKDSREIVPRAAVGWAHEVASKVARTLGRGMNRMVPGQMGRRVVRTAMVRTTMVRTAMARTWGPAVGNRVDRISRDNGRDPGTGAKDVRVRRRRMVAGRAGIHSRRRRMGCSRGTIDPRRSGREKVGKTVQRGR